MHPSSLYLTSWRLPVSLIMISFWINSEDEGGRHCIVLICLISLGSMPVKGDGGDSSRPWILLCEVLQDLMLSYSYSIQHLHRAGLFAGLPLPDYICLPHQKWHATGLVCWRALLGGTFLPLYLSYGLSSPPRLAPSLLIFQKAHKI